MSPPLQPAGADDVAGRLTIAGRPLRFLVAAGVNTAFGLAIYPVLLWSSAYLRSHYLVGLIIAQALSIAVAYANYKFGVFRTRGGYAREATVFASFYLFNFAANWAALPFLVEVVHLSPVVAQLIFSGLVMIGSYFWHSRVTFRDNK